MHIKSIYLSFKNLKGYYLIPVIIVLVFLPILTIGITYMVGDVEGSRILVFREIEKFVPLLSLWWIVFIFKEYVEGDGNELLYCVGGSGKVKLTQVLLAFFWYVTHIGALFLGYSIFWDNIFLEFLKIVIQCFFFTSSFYMLIYTLKSTTISFMLLLVYKLFALFTNSGISNYISVFEKGEHINLSIIATKYLIVLIVAFFFLIIGVRKNKRFYY